MRPLLFLLLLGSTTAFAQHSTDAHFYFLKGTTQLTASSEANLQAWLKSLQGKPITAITIEGYADADGDGVANEKLSFQRAQSIQTRLAPMLSTTVAQKLMGFGEDSLATLAPEKDSLNRYVYVRVTWASPEAPASTAIRLQPFSEDVEEQRFPVRLSDTIVIFGKEGSFIKIPPNAIQTKDGRLAKGEAEVRIKEYYEPGKILLAGVHTMSDRGLLQTGGMIKVTIVQNGDTLSQKMRKRAVIHLPVEGAPFEDMKVFNQRARGDSVSNTEWVSVGSRFTVQSAFWWWQTTMRVCDVVPERYWYYTNMPVGSRYSREYELEYSIFNFSQTKPYIRRVQEQLKKVDSATIERRLQVKYRHKGRKAFGIRQLDTTIVMRHVRSSYQAFVSDLQFINCDRFLQYKNKMDFFVRTPGFEGLQVMAYFKNLKAFLPAASMPGQYLVQNVPTDVPVVLVAIGKKGEEIYFGKTPFQTRKGAVPDIQLQKLTADELKTALKTL